MTAENNQDSPTRMQRARFVRDVQRYLLASAATLFEHGIDIGQIQYDGKSLFIGTDRNVPPKWPLQCRQDTVKMLLQSRYPNLEIGFHPVDMSPAPFELP